MLTFTESEIMVGLDEDRNERCDYHAEANVVPTDDCETYEKVAYAKVFVIVSATPFGHSTLVMISANDAREDTVSDRCDWSCAPLSQIGNRKARAYQLAAKIISRRTVPYE